MPIVESRMLGSRLTKAWKECEIWDGVLYHVVFVGVCRRTYMEIVDLAVKVAPTVSLLDDQACGLTARQQSA